jgi:hypothetical protein
MDWYAFGEMQRKSLMQRQEPLGLLLGMALMGC